MLTVCFDTARTKISEGLVLVAGFASFAGAWSEFDQAWSERLAKDDLARFEPADCAHFQGEFKKWRTDESGRSVPLDELEKRRRSLLADLMDIIHGHGLRRFGCCVPVAVHEGISRRIDHFDAYVRLIARRL